MKPSTTSPTPATGFVYSVFANVKAQEPPKRCQTASFAGFAKLLGALPVHETKAAMPLIVASEFSGERTAKGAYRADSFITNVWGVCGDHDAGTMTVAQAAAIMRKRGVECAFYTSPSHTEEHPRWRIVAPFKEAAGRESHKAAVERINWLLDGALTSESFAASQSYYIGRKAGAPFATVYVKGRRRIDECISVKRRPWRTALKGNGAGDHVEEWTQSILGGEALHPSVLSFVGYLIAKGTPRDAIRPIVTPLIERAERDPERLQAMLGAELDRMIEGAFAKGYAARGLPVDILPTPEEREEPPPVAPFTLSVVGDLMDRDFPPAEEIITGRIRLTPGAHILAGKPKHGKSWLALGIALSAVTGEEYLESRPLKPMQALYISCDDPSEARFARRVKAFKPKAKPDGLLLITDVEVDAASMLDIVGDLITKNPAVRLVVIDTLAAFRSGQRSDNPYQQEGDEVRAINKWAHAHGIVVIVVHHLRKGKVEHENVFESISGTLGLQGGGDAMMVLDRKDLESDLDESITTRLAGFWARSRDIEDECSFGIKLEDARWHVHGTIGDVFGADTQREIMQVLRSDPTRWWTSKEIHASGDFNCKADGVRKSCMRMAKRGLIDSHRGAMPGKSGGGGGYRLKPGQGVSI